jgi:transposase
VYVGIDVGRKSWHVSIYSDEFEHKTFCQPPDPDTLVGYLETNFPGASHHCVYEAGYSGFWPQLELSARGVDCIVVHPADVPTKHKERSNRTDPVDARKLARGLRNSQLTPIYVPSRAAQEDRTLVRCRHQLVKKRTRCKNQIKALLAFYGLNPPEQGASTWSRQYVEALHQLRLQHPSGCQAMDLMLQELDFLSQQITQVTRQIRDLAKQERYRDNVQLLRTIPGISMLSAMVLLTELMDVNRFKDQDHLASYVGLTPSENSSGDKRTITGLTHRRNPFLRVLLIECSWIAVRKDPALMLSFSNYTKRTGNKCRAIIRIARKVLMRIRFVLKNQQPYVTCVTQ